MKILAALFVLFALALPAQAEIRVVLSWQDNSSDETGFRVERNVESAGYLSLVTLLPDAESHVDKPLTPLTTYCYRVVALRAAGDLTSTEVCGTSPSDAQPPGQLNLVISIAP